MAELQYLREYLSTGVGTEGQLLIPRKIADVLVGETDKALIPRSEAAQLFGPGDIPGSSIDIDLDVENSMDVREIAEGTEIFQDEAEYTSINIKPKKYGVAIRITKELMEDSKFNLIEGQVKTAGKRFAENENALVISDALDQAANTVSGGAAITIANITRAMQYLDDADKNPTTLFVGMEVLNDLRNIDTFVEANKSGNTDMLTRGFIGTVYGLNVIRVSTNAGMTTTSAYVTDRDEAYYIAEKRPITVEAISKPELDLEGAVLTCRIAINTKRTNAIAKITTT